MTYTSNLDDTQPGQADKVRLGAGWLRTLTKAVKERLLTVFVDPDADPLVFKDGVVPGSALVANSIPFSAYADASIGNTKIANDTIELAKLTSAAKLGLYKLEVYNHAYTASNLLPNNSYTATIGTVAGVNGLMILVFPDETLSDATLNVIKVIAKGVGTDIHLYITNVNDSATAVIPTGTIFRIAVLRPVT